MEIDLGRLIDALPGLVWTARPDGGAEYVGKRWLEYTGLGFDEAGGAGWMVAVHPEDAPRLLAAWVDIIASGQIGEVEARMRRFDGVYRWFLFRACPMPEPSGEVLRWCGMNFDIEDRVAQERRFQVILDGLPEIAALFAPTGKIIFCNRRMLEYLGETLENVQSKPSAYNFHSDDRDEILADWTTAIRSGTPFDREARLCRADGVYRWHRTRVFPLRNAAGEIDLWYGLSTDIEDTKRAEAQLAAEKQLLELVARGAALPIALAELCRQVEALAAGCYCSILLVDADGGTFRVGAGPSLPGSFNAFLEGARIDPESGPCSLAATLKVPIIVANQARDPRWAKSRWPSLMAEHGLTSCWSVPVASSGGRVLGVFAIYRREPAIRTFGEQELIDRFANIAGIAIERADADAALKANEAELRQAYHHLTEAQRLSQTGSFTVDVLADDHSWSEELYPIFEFDPETRVSFQTVRAVIHPDDRAQFEDGFARAVGGTADFDGFFRINTRSGRLKHLHCVAHLLNQTGERPVFMGALQDITERKAAEEALNRARAELTHVSRVTALGVLTASIAHEVNQPLAGIITNASTCLRMLAADPPNLEGARATAQRTIRDGNRASEVIQRLRGLFARRSPGFESVDLNDAIREVVALSSLDLQRRRVIVRTAFDDGLPPVLGDRVQLQQVILNLVTNAADAMDGVEDRPRDLWLATTWDETGEVKLSVRDSGVGIEPQGLGRLFDAFYTTKPEGMGIGLSISRSIIESHEGRLWATANEGPGATFAFSIPGGRGSEPDGKPASHTAVPPAAPAAPVLREA